MPPAHSPSPAPPTGSDNLTARQVLVDAADRKRVIADRIAGLAAEKSLTVVDDPGLLDEVAGLVEWPVPHLGRIADEHMDLPPEVMQVSMRVNQRYFALRTADGAAAPWFAFVANIEADDDGAAIIAGNERVLRARFADARHFWDLDRKTRLETRVPALDKVTFQAKLGTQGDRVRRLSAWPRRSPRWSAPIPPRPPAPPNWQKPTWSPAWSGSSPNCKASWAATTRCMTAKPPDVADAIRDHYAPRGPTEAGALRPGFHRRRTGRQTGPTGRLLRDRRETHRLRRSLRAAPCRAGRDPDHPRKRLAPASAPSAGCHRQPTPPPCRRCSSSSSSGWSSNCAPTVPATTC